MAYWQVGQVKRRPSEVVRWLRKLRSWLRQAMMRCCWLMVVDGPGEGVWRGVGKLVVEWEPMVTRC